MKPADPAEQCRQDMIQDTHQHLCEMLVMAKGLTGNREPEMAEAIAELQRLEEEYRELFE